MLFQDTIVAPATPPGRGGVAVVRVSGEKSPEIAKAVLGKLPLPRTAVLTTFRDTQDKPLDKGLALFFPAPHSFTGEDVLELHGHGGVVVIDLLIERILALGARLARPGEFSERAFLNGKMDLVEAEAIADLIDAATQKSAKMALLTMQGAFSRQIEDLKEQLIELQMITEVSIDFPEEDIDFLGATKIIEALEGLNNQFKALQKTATQGVILREGMQVVICGRPNVGKSSLLNALSARESAIVTETPGTTRDVLREHIEIDGMPLHIIDTAGIRESLDKIEQEGVRRAHQEIIQADRILWIVDASYEPITDLAQFLHHLEIPKNKSVTVIQNKIDLIGMDPTLSVQGKNSLISLSVKTGQGLSLLKTHLKQCIGYEAIQEGGFLARRRHLDALNQANAHILQGKEIFKTENAHELLAEELRLAQRALGEITGEFTTEDLLSRIFSSFCIGK